MDRDKKETEMVYELLIDMLKQIKLFELRKLNNNKEKVLVK